MKKSAGILFGLGLAGLAMNAHALCVNLDSSLDDPSVPPGSVVMDMVPPCEAATPSTGQQPNGETSQAGNVSQPKKPDGK